MGPQLSPSGSVVQENIIKPDLEICIISLSVFMRFYCSILVVLVTQTILLSFTVYLLVTVINNHIYLLVLSFKFKIINEN